MTQRLGTFILGLSLIVAISAFAYAENHAKSEGAKAEATTAKTNKDGAAQKDCADCAKKDDKACCADKEGKKAASCERKVSADKKDAAAKSDDASAKADAKVTELGNTLCPITGEMVGSMKAGAHVDYKGIRVGLCCPGCEKVFLKDPDANLAKAKESVPKEKS